MRKTIALLLSLMMIMMFALASCGGGSEELSDSKYVGTWRAESVSFAGESGAIEGGVFKLTLNGDGTGTFVSTEDDGTEEVSNITWSLTSDGFKTKGDTKLTFKDDGEDITASFMGVDLRFIREE